MGYTKKYEIYERSSDGLLKEPEFNEGYGYTSGFYSYDTEEEAIEAVVEKRTEYYSYIIVTVIEYKKGE